MPIGSTPPEGSSFEPVAALFAAAAETPGSPFLFEPHGWEMRWRSWGAVAAQVVGGASLLSALELPPGSQVATVDGSRPDAVAAELAIRAAGHRPARGASAEAAIARVELPPMDDPHGAPPFQSFEPFEPAADPLTGEAAALAARLAAVPPPARPPRGTGGRPVLGAWLDLSLADHRAVLAWALASRAAVVLDPERRDLPQTAAWSRVTAVALPAEDLPLLAGLVRTAEARRRRRRRWLGPLARLGASGLPRPLGGRLATVLALSAPSGFRRLSGEEIGFWTQRGVHLERPGRP